MSLLKPITGRHKVSLADLDPDHHGGLSEEQATGLSASLRAELEELQTLAYAAQETAVLIVLQGMDTAGKDGVIRHVMGAMNPQSCRAASFKVPTAPEMAHDFLWRIHAQTPARGEVVIFNRSHYEDVVVVRVHKLVPEPVWEARYGQINAFEKLLTDNHTVVMKLFLHISKAEQKQRLLDREKDPAKAWKLSAQDWRERELWDTYQHAYQDAINRCAAPSAPWYVVPANHKWFRDAAVAETLVETLRPFKQRWLDHLKQIGDQAMRDIAALRTEERQRRRQG